MRLQFKMTYLFFLLYFNQLLRVRPRLSNLMGPSLFSKSFILSDGSIGKARFRKKQNKTHTKLFQWFQHTVIVELTQSQILFAAIFDQYLHPG